MTEKVLSLRLLHINHSDLLAEMGYGIVPPPEEVTKAAVWVVDRAAGLLMPRFAYHVMPGRVDINSASVYIHDSCLNVGKIIAAHLRGSEAFAFFVATAGVEYEQWRHSLSDVVIEYVADALGTLIAERCADAMEEALQASVDKLKWRHTNRFSPGYCSWDVGQQHRLFQFLGDAPCGVTLNVSALMYPIKSVSGIIGLGSGVKHLDYTCHLCNFKNCYKRVQSRPIVGTG